MEKTVKLLGSWIKNAQEKEKKKKKKSNQIDKQVSIIHRKAIDIIKKRHHGKLIRFSDVYHILSWLFHLKKEEAREFLREMEELGLIEIIPHNGVKIK